MPKKVFAVTNVKVGSEEGQSFAAGDVIDPSKFSREQLMELHEAGAIEIRVVDEDAAPDGTAVSDVVPEGTEENPPPAENENTDDNKTDE